MNMDEQKPGDDSTPQSAITKIVHDLANSANSICSTIQVLEMDLNKHEGYPRYARELIIGLKDECSRLKSHLQELRRLTTALTPTTELTGNDSCNEFTFLRNP